jgi:hypothetical protein
LHRAADHEHGRQDPDHGGEFHVDHRPFTAATGRSGSHYKRPLGIPNGRRSPRTRPVAARRKSGTVGAQVRSRLGWFHPGEWTSVQVTVHERQYVVGRRVLARYANLSD